MDAAFMSFRRKRGPGFCWSWDGRSRVWPGFLVLLRSLSIPVTSNPGAPPWPGSADTAW